MKRLLTILIVCVLCVCCAFGFTACDFGSQQNSGSEITNEQPKDEEENNTEEKIVITKDTDFDALESDKVEKDVFIDAIKFFVNNSNPYAAASFNCTVDLFGLAAAPSDSPYYDKYYETLKIDGLKRRLGIRSVIEQENILHHAELADSYTLIAEDFKSCVCYQSPEMIYREDESFLKGPDADKLNKFAEAFWESAEYNETTKQYEIVSFYNNYFDNNDVFNNVHVKIKDGYVVLFEFTNTEGYEKIVCYDFGRTSVEIPADILAAMNAVK